MFNNSVGWSRPQYSGRGKHTSNVMAVGLKVLEEDPSEYLTTLQDSRIKLPYPLTAIRAVVCPSFLVQEHINVPTGPLEC
jgi:hypothetical protein